MIFEHAYKLFHLISDAQEAHEKECNTCQSLLTDALIYEGENIIYQCDEYEHLSKAASKWFKKMAKFTSRTEVQAV